MRISCGLLLGILDAQPSSAQAWQSFQALNWKDLWRGFRHSALAVMRELLNGFYSDFGIFLHKAHKIGLRDKVRLARFKCLDS
jgi:hypothetical protein